MSVRQPRGLQERSAPSCLSTLPYTPLSPDRSPTFVVNQGRVATLRNGKSLESLADAALRTSLATLTR